MSTKHRGIAASPGIAIARAFLAPTRPGAGEGGGPVLPPDEEWERWTAAVEQSRLELLALRDATREKLGALKAEIFDAHLSILKDPELAQAVAQNIRQGGMAAGPALEAALEGFIGLLSEVEGELFKARIDDLRDLRSRLLSHVEGYARNPWAGIGGEVVIVATNLTPSETSQLDPALVRGFVTSEGSLTSHSSILARSMEIPAVVGLGGLDGGLTEGVTLIVDGGQGLVIVDPTAEELASYERERRALAEARSEVLRFARLPTRTADGRSLELLANIGGPGDSKPAIAKGAEGVGLFRTEFLFMDRPGLPTEEEQFEAYRSVLEAFSPRPVVIRTLDIGGDKGVECLELEKEPNPFLGVRAIRLCLVREDIFRTQLRALLRAGASGPLRIMFPMIATMGELRAARRILAEERLALEARGVDLGAGPEVGIMVEIPAAAAMADQLAAEADFFSVGTNDLVQYAMAADRMNAKLAYLNQALHPAILRLLGGVVEAAHARGRRAAVCGEMAADPEAQVLLVGMGYDELSMSAASIPASRAAIAGIDSRAARGLYLRARDLESAEEVRAFVRKNEDKERGGPRK